MKRKKKPLKEPVRIQRQRKRGWKMPANTVYVGRPTKWGNPFKPGDKIEMLGGTVNDMNHAAKLFDALAPCNAQLVSDAKKELRGKNLACWCPLKDKNGRKVKCHADSLLEIANAE